MRIKILFPRVLFQAGIFTTFLCCWHLNASEFISNDSDSEDSSALVHTSGAYDSDMESCNSDFPYVPSGHILQIDSLVRREIFDFIAGADVRSALNFAATCKFLHKAMKHDVGTAYVMQAGNKEKFWKALYINYIGQKSGHYKYFNAFHRQSLEESGLSAATLKKIISKRILKDKLLPLASSYFQSASPRMERSSAGLLTVSLYAGACPGFLHPNYLAPEQVIPLQGNAQKCPVSSLVLKKAGLLVLPRDIKEMKELRTLDLGNNNLRGLPAEIAELPSLKSLNISGNKNLTRLPQALLKCPKLEEIYVDVVEQYDSLTQVLLNQLKTKGVLVHVVNRTEHLETILEIDGF